MTFQRLSSLSAIALAALLGACGGQYDVQNQQLAAVSTSASQTQVVDGAASAVPAVAPAAATSAAPMVAAANMPAPDCAAEGCASLRIIDGNAEAWRVDAARRAALEVRL